MLLKVYVVYYNYDYEGCSNPIRAFSNRDMAINWAQNNREGDETCVVEMELDSDSENIDINIDYAP